MQLSGHMKVDMKHCSDLMSSKPLVPGIPDGTRLVYLPTFLLFECCAVYFGVDIQLEQCANGARIETESVTSSIVEEKVHQTTAGKLGKLGGRL